MSSVYSGSSIANVVTTGTFTIPLMKRAAFPPVMGAAAFLIAEFTRVPNTDIIRQALMPALADFGMSIVGSYFDKSFETNAVEGMAAELESWSAEHVPDEVAAEVHPAHGTIYDEIMRLADKLDRDTIVMTAHRPERRDYPLGPKAARVVRHARQSVLVTRD